MHQWSYIGCLFALFATVGAIAGEGSSVVSDVSKGKSVYQENCATCHGRSGKGDGYTKLVPPVADLTSSAIQGKLDAELIKTIHAGRPNSAMGSWRLALSEEEIQDVVAYLRTLKKD
jgi:mono/diheme cytochrome c family protein